MPLACEDAEHLYLAEDVGEEQSGRGVGQLAQLPPRGLHILLAHPLDTGSQQVQGVQKRFRRYKRFKRSVEFDRS